MNLRNRRNPDPGREPGPAHGRQRAAFGRMLRFIAVGLVSTGLYALLALAFLRLAPMPAAVASLAAVVCCGAFSYFAHRIFTFASTAAHTVTAPRFAGVTLLAYAIALVTPWIVSDIMGHAPAIGIALVCVLVPVANFGLLNLFVFGRKDVRQGARA